MTKKKILTVSSKLFYENGIENVRLQQIADEANISVGNLAYHYKNKEAIVSAIYEEVFTEMNSMLDGLVPQQNLIDFDKKITALYKFNNQFSFCFNNVFEIARNYPHLQERWHTINSYLLNLINKRLNIYTDHGLLMPEPSKGVYKLLSNQLLLNFLTWIPYQQLKGKSASLANFKKSLWSLIYPYLTAKGLREFNELGITI